MSAKFLHILHMAATGEYNDKDFASTSFGQCMDYLPYMLANAKDTATLERFTDKFPQTRDWLADPVNMKRCISLAPHDAPLMKHMAHDPLVAEALRRPARRNGTGKSILARLPEHILARGPEIERQVGQLRMLSKSQIELVLMQPENHLLDDLLRTRGMDEFKELFSCLSPENQKLVLDRISNSEHGGLVESSDTLQMLIKAAGTDPVRKSYLDTLIPYEIKEIQESDRPQDEKQTLIEMALREQPDSLGREPRKLQSRACAQLDRHAAILDQGHKAFLEIFSLVERRAILSEAQYHVVCRTIMCDNAEGLRMLCEMMDPEQRERVFHHPGVLREVQFHAMIHDDLSFFEELRDILPPHVMEYAYECHRPPDLKGPEGTEAKPPAYDLSFQPPPRDRGAKQAFYDDLVSLLRTASQAENNGTPDAEDIIHKRAGKLAGLFDNLKSVDRYLANMRKGYGAGKPKQPVHDACLFTLPTTDFDRGRWGRMIINYGPAASKFLPLAADIDGYAASHGLPLPATPREIVEIAKYVTYKRYDERPALASACLSHGVPEGQFNRILDVLNGKLKLDNGTTVTLKTSSNIPSLTIDGADIGLPGYVMKKLDLDKEAEELLAGLAKDGRLTDREIASILGEISYCCQSIGKAGEQFTLHGLTSEDSDFYVWIKKRDGKPDQMIAQSWVWNSNRRKTLTFDSIEPLGTAHNHIFKDFMQEFAKRLHEEHGYERVTIGKGGKTPDLGLEDADPPARLAGFDFSNTGAEYDSEKQWEIRP